MSVVARDLAVGRGGDKALSSTRNYRSIRRASTDPVVFLKYYDGFDTRDSVQKRAWIVQTIQTILREQGRNVIKTQNPRALVCALEEHREAMEGLEGGFFLEHTSTDVSLAAYTLHAGNMYKATKGPSSSVL